MICNKCGKKINTDFNLCPYCGEPINNQTATTGNPTHKRRRNFIKLISISCSLLLVAVGIFVIVMCLPNKTPPTITRHGKICDSSGTITGYYFSIKANDNYEDVTIEYTFYTHSGDIFARNKLTRKDCEKDKTYSLEVRLYQTQISYIDFSNVVCKIISFD